MAPALAFAFTSAPLWKRSTVSRSFLRSSRRSEAMAGGGTRSGTLKFGALGSASITNGACEAPRYADPPLGCIFGSATYAGTEPFGPSFFDTTDPTLGRWLFGETPGLNPAVGK